MSSKPVRRFKKKFFLAVACSKQCREKKRKEKKKEKCNETKIIRRNFGKTRDRCSSLVISAGGVQHGNEETNKLSGISTR